MENNASEGVLAALSARIMALEGAVHALAQCSTGDRGRAVSVFDAFAEQTLDALLARPVDDGTLALIRQSFDDIRALMVDAD